MKISVTFSQFPPQAFVFWKEQNFHFFEGECAAQISLWVEDLITKIETLEKENLEKDSIVDADFVLTD